MTRYLTIFFPLILIPFLFSSAKDSGPWQKWMEEVDIIMTKAERSVFKSLKTEEDKKRFQESFWKMRDPNPQTPTNEYKIEYFERIKFAEKNLGGARSDRGRIYVLLGTPLEKKQYIGEEAVVDCELWNYKSDSRPGLPPYFNIIFYKQTDFGDYKLFYPGLHTALDLLSPGNRISINSELQAYNEIRAFYAELAQATLSVIPGENDPVFRTPMSSSSAVFTQIFTMPEKEVNKSYLRNFTSVEGMVDVSYSTKEIDGKCDIAITENRGFKFLNYSLMPDAVNTVRAPDNLNTAKISLNLRINDLKGKTIFQEERQIDLRLDDSQKKAMLEQKKVAFRDFVPIVEGEFSFSIAFINKTTEEFFNYKENLSINEKTVPIMTGYKIKEIDSRDFMPFCMGNYKILSDSRAIFNKSDSLEGIILSDEIPKIYLRDIDDKDNSLEIKNIEKKENFVLFRQPLAEMRAANYYLFIENDNDEIYKKIISIMPFQAEKIIDFERSDTSSSDLNYIFIIAQQHLNLGAPDKALEYFRKLPEDSWRSKTLFFVANAYFMKKDYEKVVGLLENNAEKDYSMLLILGNSLIELKRSQQAAECFELLRNYGDTAQINRILGDIYHSLGEEEKAKIYWERAKKLETTNPNINSLK